MTGANAPMTLAQAVAACREVACTLTHLDDEYRVAPRWELAARREACAYYTNDLADAVGTARAMFERRLAHLAQHD